MTKVEMPNPVSIAGLSEIQSDFESVAQEMTQAQKIQGDEASKSEGTVMTEQDFVDMVIEQSLINESVRRMKADQQRLEEIINEV
ncbi:hypothetical protein ACODM8_16870 [Vibrio ostreicida]|uniref:Flagellar hook-basal body complex protein FliE n=1 Tax=Vibrio ostreicida TaxID=526588 RepID=A0ABT8BY80_9VIBR|nr:hypothetical protein [Vibrio ostreicida]MDN3612016.1 hypothetical protein [Vibrio ostreicida]NPD08811.1 hypothetical protein [Vibrio ostreicida]